MMVPASNAADLPEVNEQSTPGGIIAAAPGEVDASQQGLSGTASATPQAPDVPESSVPDSAQRVTDTDPIDVNGSPQKPAASPGLN